ncbi:MAG: hypothetical protein OEW67_14425 [Cyclobacteriaceae bacterium]|nr:hypothetical protein [Cyclobacteriaceae bacterium]
MKTISLKFLLGIFFYLLCTASGCDPSNVDPGPAILSSIEINLVDETTGDTLIAPDSRYHPDSIQILNTKMDVANFKTALDSIYEIYYVEFYPNPLGRFYNYVPPIDWDTTFYMKLNHQDIDTINISYQYDQHRQYYFMILKYNDYTLHEKDFDMIHSSVQLVPKK